MKARAAAALALLACAALAGWGQPRYLIPRRVFTEPLASAPGVEVGPEEQVLLARLPGILQARAAALVDIVPVSEPGRANSVIAVSAAPQGDAVAVTASLKEGGTAVSEGSFSFRPGSLDYQVCAAWIEETAQRFVGHLGPVEPQVKVTSRVREQRLKRVVEQIDFADSMNRRLELSVWAGQLFRMMREGGLDSYPRALPLRLDAAWFFGPSAGLVASLYFDRNVFMTFARDDSTRTDFLSRNTFLLPGIGVSYRTLDRISGGFTLMVRVGPVNVYALEDLQNVAWDGTTMRTGISLAQGESAWVLYELLTVEGYLAFNLTPRMALKLRTAVSVNPFMLIGVNLNTSGYNMEGVGVFFEPVGLGLALRL